MDLMEFLEILLSVVYLFGINWMSFLIFEIESELEFVK